MSRRRWRSAALFKAKTMPSVRQKGGNYAYRSFHLFVVPRRRNTGHPGSITSAGCCRDFRSDWTSRVTGLRPTHLPGTGLYLGSWLLGLRSRWLLLGSGHLGISARSGSALDSRVLGLRRRRLLRLVPGLLGTRSRLLWRH